MGRGEKSRGPRQSFLSLGCRERTQGLACWATAPTEPHRQPLVWNSAQSKFLPVRSPRKGCNWFNSEAILEAGVRGKEQTEAEEREKPAGRGASEGARCSGQGFSSFMESTEPVQLQGAGRGRLQLLSLRGGSPQLDRKQETPGPRLPDARPGWCLCVCFCVQCVNSRIVPLFLSPCFGGRFFRKRAILTRERSDARSKPRKHLKHLAFGLQSCPSGGDGSWAGQGAAGRRLGLRRRHGAEGHGGWQWEGATCVADVGCPCRTVTEDESIRPPPGASVTATHPGN